MTTNGAQARNARASFSGQSDAAKGLALVRVTIGAMFVWVFFENLGKGLYSPSAYSDLINYYIQKGHSPAAWKAVMALAASHAHMAAPMQAATQVTPGALMCCLHGGTTRPPGGDGGICVRVSVIIPTHNEAQAIGRVLADL